MVIRRRKTTKARARITKPKLKTFYDGTGRYAVVSETKAGVMRKADRLARGISPCAALYEALENTHITIETVAEPFDRTTFEVRAVLGRIELENIAQRTQMGREGNIKGGNNHIRPPFSWDYDPDTKRWVKNEFEAKWVCQIFITSLSGKLLIIPHHLHIPQTIFPPNKKVFPVRVFAPSQHLYILHVYVY